MIYLPLVPGTAIALLSLFMLLIMVAVVHLYAYIVQWVQHGLRLSFNGVAVECQPGERGNNCGESIDFGRSNAWEGLELE
ncbi:hypothetical protein BD310DRAFT_929481 [Dichomitus squalens]|uniref:Uncharacterized protein n=1 Tax=Dichomitus squalens TaxID=114155 RepID=A0A4Q9PSE7_9APHY|nr:hypothetical protein BD310DRAFT_929481 [Dichomitus squalens]